MMFNQHELRELVRRHCGSKMDKGEKICEACAKKLSRARKIEKQIDQMWRKYDAGFFNTFHHGRYRPDNRERGNEPKKQEIPNQEGVDTRTA